LHDVLWEKYAIEVPVIAFANTIWIRISVQVFNTDEQYHYLAQVIKNMRKKDILSMMKSKNQA
jgi:isopenicillin-N epimerase